MAEIQARQDLLSLDTLMRYPPITLLLIYKLAYFYYVLKIIYYCMVNNVFAWEGGNALLECMVILFSAKRNHKQEGVCSTLERHSYTNKYFLQKQVIERKFCSPFPFQLKMDVLFRARRANQ